MAAVLEHNWMTRVNQANKQFSRVGEMQTAYEQNAIYIRSGAIKNVR